MRLSDTVAARLLEARRECVELEARRKRASEVLEGVEAEQRAAGTRWATADRELTEALVAEFRSSGPRLC